MRHDHRVPGELEQGGEHGLDLGREVDVRAVQVNLAEQDYQLAASTDDAQRAQTAATAATSSVHEACGFGNPRPFPASGTSTTPPAETPVPANPPGEEYDPQASGSITSLLLDRSFDVVESSYNAGGMVSNCSGSGTNAGVIAGVNALPIVFRGSAAYADVAGDLETLGYLDVGTVRDAQTSAPITVTARVHVYLYAAGGGTTRSYSVDPGTSVALLWGHPQFRPSAMSADGSAFGIIHPHASEGAEGFLLELRGVPVALDLVGLDVLGDRHEVGGLGRLPARARYAGLRVDHHVLDVLTERPEREQGASEEQAYVEAEARVRADIADGLRRLSALRQSAVTQTGPLPGAARRRPARPACRAAGTRPPSGMRRGGVRHQCRTVRAVAAAAATSRRDRGVAGLGAIKGDCIDQGHMHVEMRSKHVRLPLIDGSGGAQRARGG